MADDVLPIRKPIDIRTLLGAMYNAPALSNLDNFIENVAQIESSGGKDTVSDISSARGIYQFLTKGEGNAFQTGLNRTERTYKLKGDKVPSWINEARKHNDPNKLTPKQQEDVMLANLYQQKGTDDYFRRILAGDKLAQAQMYGTYHHTVPDIYKDDRISEIFGIEKRQEGGPVNAGQPYLVAVSYTHLTLPTKA